MLSSPPWPHGRLLPPARWARLSRGELGRACRRLASPVYLGDHTALCRVLGWYKTYVDTRDIGVGAHLLLDGAWEGWVTDALIRRVKPGMRVADVGANLGYFSLLMSGLVGAQGRVDAFEPVPRMAELFERTLSTNGVGNVRLHRCALGPHDGEARVVSHDARLPGGASVGAAATEGCQSAPVVGRRLDAVPGADAIELVKIDTEGAEDLVWRGMEGLVAGPRLRCVVMEWTHGAYADPLGFAREIAAAGFSISYLRPAGGVEALTPARLAEAPPEAYIMLLLER